MNRVLWISHRGESIDAPENTVPAFQLSFDRKTDGMECDIHLTADGKVVVGHDVHTGRMGDIVRNLEKDTFEELQKVNVAGAFTAYGKVTLPLFEETLACLGRNRTYYVELKSADPGLVKAVKVILNGHPEIAAEQIVFISFHAEALLTCKREMPEYETLFLMSGNDADEVLMAVDACGADGVDLNFCNEIDAAFVGKIHGRGKMIAVWTVDHPGAAKRLIDAGVDAITSNRAAALRAVCEKF